MTFRYIKLPKIHSSEGTCFNEYILNFVICTSEKDFWSILFISFHIASLWGRPDFSLEWVNIISSEKLACFILQIENLINIVCPHVLLESLELNPWATPSKEISSSQCIFFYAVLTSHFIFLLFSFNPSPPRLKFIISFFFSVTSVVCIT